MKGGRIASGSARLLAHLLLFVTLGPPVGSAVFLAAVGVWVLATQGVGLDAFGGIALGAFAWIVTLPLAYIIGVPAAALAGGLVSLLPRANRAGFLLLSLLGGAVSTAVSLRLWLLRPEWSPGVGDREAAAAMVMGGAVAAVLCARAAHGVGPLWSRTPYRVGTAERKSPAPSGSGADPDQ